MKSERVLSGIKPTGELHIGNYFGMIRQSIDLQERFDGTRFYFLADLHAITIPYEQKTLAQNTLEMAIELLALGLDPHQSVFFVQSHVPQHTELATLFSGLLPVSELERMTQYKDVSKKGLAYRTAGLLMYPVLMAADILIYKATRVPVGDDQLQHLELARVVVRKFNKRFGETFPEPKPLITKTSRVMSLIDPKRKMNKSDGAKSYIALADEPNVIKEKLAKAVTATTGGGKNPGVDNLLSIMAEVSDENTVREFESAEKNGTIRYSDLKERLANDLDEHFAPFRKKRAELLKKPSYVREVLEEGRRRATTIAEETMEEVRGKMGLLK